MPATESEISSLLVILFSVNHDNPHNFGRNLKQIKEVTTGQSNETHFNLATYYISQRMAHFLALVSQESYSADDLCNTAIISPYVILIGLLSHAFAFLYNAMTALVISFDRR